VWHENGQLGVQETYNAGKAEGLATTWNEKGLKQREVMYRAGRLIPETFKQWDATGQQQFPVRVEPSRP